MSDAEQEHIRSRAKNKTVIQQIFERIGEVVQSAVNKAGDSEGGKRLYEAYESWRKQAEDRLQENARKNKRRHRWACMLATRVQYALQFLRGKLVQNKDDPAALAILLVSGLKTDVFFDTVSDHACPSRTQSLKTIKLCGAASAQPILAQTVA